MGLIPKAPTPWGAYGKYAQRFGQAYNWLDGGGNDRKITIGGRQAKLNRMELPYSPMRVAGMATGGVNAVKNLARLNRKANAEQVVSHSVGDNLNDVYKMLEGAPVYKGGALRRGRLYQLPGQMVRSGRKGEDEARLAIIQDPKSGALFASRGDYHHGELMTAVDKIKYMRENPGIILDPSGRMPRSTFNGWMQHEVFAKQGPASGRVNFSGTKAFNPDGFDSRSAEIGRMRLLRDLKNKAGYVTSKTTPDGTSALTRLMRNKYNVAPEKKNLGFGLSNREKVALLEKMGQGIPAGRPYRGKN